MLSFSERKSKSTKNKFREGNVLYGKLRPYLNKVVIAKRAGVCTTEIVPLDGGKYLHNNYLFHWLKHPLFTQYVTTVGYGVNMPRLGTKEGNEAPFVLAPLAEQHQIAQKLDELLDQVDTIKARLDTIPSILKRFRQSVLSAAVSGKLTEEWRKINTQEIWQECELKFLDISLQIGPFGSLLHKSDYIENGIPLINPMHINDGIIYPSSHMSISKEKALELKKYGLNIGDVILGRRGEMGRAAVVNNQNFICGTGSLFLRPNIEKFNPKFICLFFRSPQTIKKLEADAVGSTMVNLNQKVLQTLMCPNISIIEQTEIVRIVDQLFTYADQINQRVNDAKSRVDKLTQSILAKAFRGELTADWRAEHPELISGENSAEALLAKIQAAKAALDGKKTRKKTS